MSKPSRNYYDETIDRIEPDIAMIDPGAFYASAAISLKRIADHLDRHPTPDDTGEAARNIGSYLIFNFNVMLGKSGEAIGLEIINDLAKIGFKVVRR